MALLVALDRVIALASQIDTQERATGWTAVRDEIRTAILEHGWNERAGAFTQAFGGEDLDASNLMLVIIGFLPGDDPHRAAGTAQRALRVRVRRDEP